MKTDTEYSSINECPKTGERMFQADIYDTDGICPYCGHEDSYVSHHNKVVGRWIRPNWFERFFKGKHYEFLRKDEEDKIISGLTQ